MSLEFKPGYYEWSLFDGDEMLHTWDDGYGKVFLEIDGIEEEGAVTEESCCDIADLLMQSWKSECEADGIPFIDEDLFVAATEVIVNELMRRYM